MDEHFARATPGRGHRAIASLYRAGKVPAVVTQNIDNLHQTSGIPAEDIVELHGKTTFARCLDCNDRFELQWVRRHMDAGNGCAPDCPSCGGYIKTATISFGQAMPDAARPDFRSWRSAAALCSSLSIANPPISMRSADLVVREDIGTVLEPFVAA
jgi:NAD-dependent deacetylase